MIFFGGFVYSIYNLVEGNSAVSTYKDGT